MASRQPGFLDGNIATAFLWPAKWLLGLLLIYVLLGLAALAVAFAFAKFHWEDPLRASEALFQTEAARVSDLMGTGRYASRYFNLPVLTQRWTYRIFFRATRLDDMARLAISGAPVVEPFDRTLSGFVGRNLNELYVAMNVIQVYGFRLGFLLAAIPLFAMLFVISLVDGLTERYLRRACAGRESADLNKLGKLSKLMLLATLVTLYLCLPVPMSPFWVVVPLAAVYVLATRVQWQFYKKYF